MPLAAAVAAEVEVQTLAAVAEIEVQPSAAGTEAAVVAAAV